MVYMPGMTLLFTVGFWGWAGVKYEIKTRIDKKNVKYVALKIKDEP